MSYELSHLNTLWDALGKITVRDEDGDVVTDEPFLHFPTGTSLFPIWSWFESLHDEFVVAVKLYNTSIPGVSTERKSK
ncbi:hypothetical protein SB6095_03376 [Klebsiella quasivariicola]|uniref:hypothetical protein n=1 Tax=Klebsiella TaxID=570 RepID=UPI00109CD3EC|nr:MULTISPECIES: hypothetical protein [Enterobacteriaceae]HDS3618010.1 hypothetical protein [Klebsiella pneumoniae subsp. pneumoniae]EFH4566517.1 hypothetical protein [Escherichia coli]EGD4410688.1 hypothetical protein [Escherichia coli]EHH4358186.1 hypothetical protein [Escherichia coli]EIT7441273.1 hypothetical protein [Escherichia coli]